LKTRSATKRKPTTHTRAQGTARRAVRKRPQPDSEIADKRREQIIVAAMGVISTEGIHNFSLSRIEQRTKMRRGQLTYYFPEKEAILLAVFDRMLLLMFERMGRNVDQRSGIGTAWECVQEMLNNVLNTTVQNQDFQALQYTFLAQIAHRKDFKDKLASVYREWRSVIGAHWYVSGKPLYQIKASPKTLGAFIQALAHGLTLQLAADADAFDRKEMLELCIQTLAPIFIGGEQSTRNEAHQ